MKCRPGCPERTGGRSRRPCPQEKRTTELLKAQREEGSSRYGRGRSYRFEETLGEDRLEGSGGDRQVNDRDLRQIQRAGGAKDGISNPRDENHAAVLTATRHRGVEGLYLLGGRTTRQAGGQNRCGHNREGNHESKDPKSFHSMILTSAQGSEFRAPLNPTCIIVGLRPRLRKTGWGVRPEGASPAHT